LVPYQDGIKQSQSSHATWLMDGLWAAFWLGVDSNQARNQGGVICLPRKYQNIT